MQKASVDAAVPPIRVLDPLEHRTILGVLSLLITTCLLTPEMVSLLPGFFIKMPQRT